MAIRYQFAKFANDFSHQCFPFYSNIMSGVENLYSIITRKPDRIDCVI